jgi:hypothetical protein
MPLNPTTSILSKEILIMIYLYHNKKKIEGENSIETHFKTQWPFFILHGLNVILNLYNSAILFYWKAEPQKY